MARGAPPVRGEGYAHPTFGSPDFVIDNLLSGPRMRTPGMREGGCRADRATPGQPQHRAVAEPGEDPPAFCACWGSPGTRDGPRIPSQAERDQRRDPRRDTVFAGRRATGHRAPPRVRIMARLRAYLDVVARYSRAPH